MSEPGVNEMVRRRVRFGSAVLHQEDHHMQIASIGIDLGKATFHLVALGERNKVLVRKKFSRATLLTYTANLTGPPPPENPHISSQLPRSSPAIRPDPDARELSCEEPI